MAITPTFSIQFCRIIAGLLNEFQAVTGMSDSRIAQATGKSRDTIAVVRNFNGATAAPNMTSLIAIEAFIRVNFDADEKKSEQLYRDALARGILAAGYSGGKFRPPGD